MELPCKVKVGVLRPVQQPGSYWDRSSELPWLSTYRIGRTSTLSVNDDSVSYKMKYNSLYQLELDIRNIMLTLACFRNKLQTHDCN